MELRKNKVLLGLSGGVDSATAALLLKEKGCEVVGYYFDVKGKNEAGRASAEDVAKQLNIPLIYEDVSTDFREIVIENFITEYLHGRTPNPCVLCNPNIKFKRLIRHADEIGAYYIATGHYCRILRDETRQLSYIHRAVNDQKDQSYMLYRLPQEIISRLIFPLAEFAEKESVRNIARKNGLSSAEKSDSQEICFVEDDDYAKFITDYSGYKPKEGDILDVNGNVIGKHRGLIYYTIGQRKGIGAYGRPMFVMKIDAENNTITLGEKGMEFSNELTAYDVNFVSGEFPKENMLITAKVRYQAPPAAAMLCPQKDGTVKLMFPEPQRAVTPGQAVVFYDGDIVLGGGTVL